METEGVSSTKVVVEQDSGLIRLLQKIRKFVSKGTTLCLDRIEQRKEITFIN